MSKQLIVCDVAVKQDAEGRYCLNDLHKASGGEERHATWRFIRLDTTEELIKEIQTTISGGIAPVASKAGRYGGTFVVKELVYAYAMWISPQFHLKVIRAYDKLATEGMTVHEAAAADVLDDPLSFMEKILGQAKQLKAERDRLAAENAFMHDELHLVTMDEYRSLTHRYFDPSYRQRLRWAARKLARTGASPWRKHSD